MVKKDSLGAHLEFDRKHPGQVFREAKALGANAIQIFTKPPRKLFAEPFPANTIKKWKEAWSKSGIDRKLVFAHASHVLNLARKDLNPKALLNEAKLCEQLGIKTLVVYPGTNTIGDFNMAINNIVSNITKCLERVPKVTILLETMYKGKIGATFEDLALIIKKVKNKSPSAARRLGVCIDTAHLHIAGYFIHTPLLMRRVVTRFKLNIGLSKLKLIHINNTLMRVGSKRDEHVGVSIGRIPLKALRCIVSEHALKKVPYILETHTDYASEMKALRCNVAPIND
jgi:apurinic endonuclease APN1